jgi:hypothetical protein
VSLLLGNDCYNVLEELFHGFELPMRPPRNAKLPAMLFQCSDAYTQTPRCLVNGQMIQGFQGLPCQFRAPAKVSPGKKVYLSTLLRNVLGNI